LVYVYEYFCWAFVQKQRFGTCLKVRTQDASYTLIIKVKLTTCLTNLALHNQVVCGSGCIDPHFLHGTSWRWVVSFTPLPLYPREKSPQYPLHRRLDGPQSRSEWHGQVKILAHTGTRTPTLGRPARSQALYRLRYNNTLIILERFVTVSSSYLVHVLGLWPVLSPTKSASVYLWASSANMLDIVHCLGCIQHLRCLGYWTIPVYGWGREECSRAGPSERANLGRDWFSLRGSFYPAHDDGM
jgi:hypothetical protein